MGMFGGGGSPQALSPSDSPTFAGLTVSGLTSGRVVLAGTGGVLQDSSNLTFSGSTLTGSTIQAAASFVLTAAGAQFIQSNATDGFRFSNAATSQFFYLNALTDQTLSLVNGVTAQAFSIYGAYTSATNYSRVSIKHATTTLLAVSGASVTATSLIPAGAQVLSVNSRVTTALGTSNGTTGYAVGTAADPNLWGDVVGTATTTSSGQANATADPVGVWAAAARDVIVTAAGGNFDATGAIYLDVAYTMTEAD